MDDWLSELRRLEAEVSELSGDWEVGGPYPSVSVITCVDGGCGDGFGECPEPPRYEPICQVHTDDRLDAPPPPASSILLAKYISLIRNHACDLIADATQLRRLRWRSILNDPFRILLDAFDRLFPHADVEIQFVSGLHEKDGDPLGHVTFPNDGSTPLIEIDGDLPVSGAVDILAHELAHVVCEGLGLNHQPQDPHGKYWQEIYDKLHDEYDAEVRRAEEVSK